MAALAPIAGMTLKSAVAAPSRFDTPLPRCRRRSDTDSLTILPPASLTTTESEPKMRTPL